MIEIVQNENGTYTAFHPDQPEVARYAGNTAYKAAIALLKHEMGMTRPAPRPPGTPHPNKGKVWLRHPVSQDVVKVPREEAAAWETEKGYVRGRKSKGTVDVENTPAEDFQLTSEFAA